MSEPSSSHLLIGASSSIRTFVSFEVQLIEFGKEDSTKHGVMHRDLKPENFLFANKKESASLKAIDFGLSVFFKPGVILYILLCGVPPFWAETEHGVAKAILRSVIDFRRDPWPKVSDNAKDLIKKMLHPDPRRRL
ncbi:unnamed protein product [Arabidopsis arenosa]|uniref:Protein kinase domain-containing protein n=1 Tax=Arabidopsis arenosa TaxID=38785 RepID=A0A8S2A551_ARAAE|nr:unnamed protein product [Arabidopsis arenosa]